VSARQLSRFTISITRAERLNNPKNMTVLCYAIVNVYSDVCPVVSAPAMSQLTAVRE
jgi:hypothetical protein